MEVLEKITLELDICMIQFWMVLYLLAHTHLGSWIHPLVIGNLQSHIQMMESTIIGTNQRNLGF